MYWDRLGHGEDAQQEPDRVWGTRWRMSTWDKLVLACLAGLAGLDSHDNSDGVHVSIWGASAGSITTGGLFTAPSVGWPVTITANLDDDAPAVEPPATGSRNDDPVQKTKQVAVPKVTIFGFASTYDGEDSSVFECRVEPANVPCSSYQWSWECDSPSFNDPQVTFTRPSEQSTKIQNTRWYSTTPSPGTSSSANYKIYCTVEFDGFSLVNESPAFSSVKVYSIGGFCTPPGIIGTPYFSYIETNGSFICTGVNDFHRKGPEPHNNYLTTSQFYPKVQGHELQHEEDFNGFDNHLFYEESELSALITGLNTNSFNELALTVGEKITQYLVSEAVEFNSLENEFETRAYAVSDEIGPAFVYQHCGL